MMKLRVSGKTVNGQLDRRYADSPVGHAVIKLDGNVIVEPSFAMMHDYQIVEATAEERAALKAAGYDLSDWRDHER